MTKILLAVALMLSATSAIAGEFDESGCQGGVMSAQQALSYFTPGQNTSRVFSDFQYSWRARSCNTLTGCTAWAPVDLSHAGAGYERDGHLHFVILTGQVWVVLQMGGGLHVSTNMGRIDNFLRAGVPVDYRVGIPDIFYTTPDRTMVVQTRISKFTDRCMQIVVNALTKPDSTSSYVEQELGTVATFR